MVDAQVESDVAEVARSTGRLLAITESLDDATLRRPSLLPGWTVGHVLSHLARNADGLLALLAWARTGVVTPMYPSPEVRNGDIEAGSGRTAAQIHDDLRGSAARLDDALVGFSASPEDVLERRVLLGAPPAGTVPDLPARDLAFARWRELEIHLVDLGLDAYGPQDWPEAFVTRTTAWIEDRHGSFGVTGDPALALAWRIGRRAGDGLTGPGGTAPGAPAAWA